MNLVLGIMGHGEMGQKLSVITQTKITNVDTLYLTVGSMIVDTLYLTGNYKEIKQRVKKRKHGNKCQV